MARIRQCGVWNNAKQHRLVSSIPAYSFQILYHIKQCKGHTETKNPDGTVLVKLCTDEHMQWRGEYPDGTFTEFFDIPAGKFEYWLKRAERDQARPEIQLTSEYSERITRNPADVLSYWIQLDKAKLWWKGKRVDQA